MAAGAIRHNQIKQEIIMRGHTAQEINSKQRGFPNPRALPCSVSVRWPPSWPAAAADRILLELSKKPLPDCWQRLLNCTAKPRAKPGTADDTDHADFQNGFPQSALSASSAVSTWNSVFPFDDLQRRPQISQRVSHARVPRGGTAHLRCMVGYHHAVEVVPL